MSENAAPENAAPDAAASETPDAEGTAEADAPLNRAERRKAAKSPRQPGHVGPQNDPTRSGRGPRPHTKRQI